MLWLDSARHGIRYGGRLIRKSLLLSIAMIVTLATGIGLDAGASSRRFVGVRCRGDRVGCERSRIGRPDALPQD
jgi:hypothetical protein